MLVVLFILSLLLTLIIYTMLQSDIVFFGKISTDLKDFRYKIDNKEILAKVNIDEVLKEKGKDARYLISVYEGEQFLEKIEISGTTYSLFIGEENNAVKIIENNLIIYMARISRFTKKAKFKGELYSIELNKIIYPWSDSNELMDEHYARKIVETDGFRSNRFFNNRRIRFVDANHLPGFDSKK